MSRSPHDANITRLLDAGLTNKQIAAELEIAERTVSRRRAALGASGAVNEPYSAETLARVEQLLGEGWSLLEIARTENLDYRTLRRKFPGRGWTRQQIVTQSVILRHWHANYGTYNYAATLNDLKQAERKVA